MKKLDNQELLSINGGLTISGTLINSLVKGISVILDLGRALGTAIRRVTSSTLCPL